MYVVDPGQAVRHPLSSLVQAAISGMLWEAMSFRIVDLGLML